MPDKPAFEQQGQNITGPQTNIAGGIQGPVLSGRFEVIQSIITTGNNSPVFVGGYKRLRDAVIQPDQVFKRVQTESFVGRRWLIDQVDRILNDGNNSCGYLMLEAHAGLGKTAFLAWLVKERNYIHHFVELAPGQEGIERGLKNLAAQIILAYGLSTDEAIPDAAGRPDYLYHLLSQATEKRAPGERIVVVVDALDEAGTPLNLNVLGLPKVLPEGVFFIVSMRPVQVILQSDRSSTPRWPLKILAESPENLADLKSFLKASAAWPKVAKVLEESEYTPDDFVDAFMKKSKGLWIYMHFVIPEIERGERSPLDLDKLPEGLQEYYASYWTRWRENDKWYGLYLPILTTLAAAQESSTLERMIDWSGIGTPEDEKPRLRRILKEEWRPFLAISGEGVEEKYRFYHATVREFFEGKVKQNSSTATENDFIIELSQATKKRHKLIAERYLARWGGLEKRLPDLVNKDEDNGYGLRHLAAHLEASGQDNELHHLLKLETSQGRNLWYEAKEAIGDTTGYINDVMRGRGLAEENYDPEDIEKTGQFIGLQNRYALIFASINSLSGNIPCELLLALVENGIWSKEEVLAHARHVPDREDRARILAELSSILKEPKLLDEAIATAREIPDDWRRAQALTAIAAQLLDTHEALAVAREMQVDLYRAEALASIAPELSDAHEALAVAREIQDDRYRAQALASIAPELPDTQKREILDEALKIAREIQDDWCRDEALASVVPKLPDAHEALAVAREIQDIGWRAHTLASIVPRLPDAQKREVLDEALVAARETEYEEYRAQAMERIVLILHICDCLISSSLWPPTIHSLSIRRRDDLLSDLSSLSPLVAKLGGDDALLETIQAIKDVGRWWP